MNINPIKLALLVFIAVIQSGTLVTAYSTEVEYLSLFSSKVIEKNWTVVVRGPFTVGSQLDCINRCNRDSTCRVISITGTTCTHYRITNWNFTVSEEVSSTTFIKVDHTQPRIKTYNYYSMVILCKCSLNKNNSFQIGLPFEIGNTNRFTFWFRQSGTCLMSN